MVNPIRKIKQGIEDFLGEHLIATAAATAYVGATMALNGLFYVTSAAMEGVERALGASSYSVTAELKEKGIAIGPHSKIPYGIFVDSEGKELKLMDSSVVTEGKFLPGTLRKMDEGKSYEVEVFGSQK